MKNKGALIVLTIVVSLLCMYLINFTFVARSLEKDALTIATDTDGNVDRNKKQKYLDSLSNVSAYKFLGIVDYNYKEVKVEYFMTYMFTYIF